MSEQIKHCDWPGKWGLSIVDVVMYIHSHSGHGYVKYTVIGSVRKLAFGIIIKDNRKVLLNWNEVFILNVTTELVMSKQWNYCDTSFVHG